MFYSWAKQHLEGEKQTILQPASTPDSNIHTEMQPCIHFYTPALCDLSEDSYNHWWQRRRLLCMACTGCHQRLWLGTFWKCQSHVIMNIKQPCIAHDYLTGGGDLTDRDVESHRVLKWCMAILWQQNAPIKFTEKLCHNLWTRYLFRTNMNYKQSGLSETCQNFKQAWLCSG